MTLSQQLLHCCVHGSQEDAIRLMTLAAAELDKLNEALDTVRELREYDRKELHKLRDLK
jgi:hypothetical protein